jgi:hypothetical protein
VVAVIAFDFVVSMMLLVRKLDAGLGVFGKGGVFDDEIISHLAGFGLICPRGGSHKSHHRKRHTDQDNESTFFHGVDNLLNSVKRIFAKTFT